MMSFILHTRLACLFAPFFLPTSVHFMICASVCLNCLLQLGGRSAAGCAGRIWEGQGPCPLCRKDVKGIVRIVLRSGNLVSAAKFCKYSVNTRLSGLSFSAAPSCPIPWSMWLDRGPPKNWFTHTDITETSTLPKFAQPKPPGRRTWVANGTAS